MPCSTTRIAVVVGLSLCSLVYGQSERGTLYRRNFAESTISRAVALSDVNLDGAADFALGVPDANNGSGAVRMLSGRDLSTIWTYPGDANSPELGRDLARVPDVDGDGFSDLVATAVSFGTQPLRWISGLTGATITSAPLGSFQTQPLGLGVHPFRDYDADGEIDVVVSEVGPFPGMRSLRIVSRTSGILTTVPLPGFQPESVAPLEVVDLTGDGVVDIVVGLPNGAVNFGSPQVGIVRAFDGATLTELWAQPGLVASQSRLGSALAAVSDQSGDGQDDLIVGQPGSGGSVGPGSIVLMEGTTGAWLSLAFPPPTAQVEHYGSSLLAVPQSITGRQDSVYVGCRPLAMVSDPLSAFVALEAWAVNGALVTGGGWSLNLDPSLLGGNTPARLTGGGDHNADGLPDVLVTGTGPGGGIWNCVYRTPGRSVFGSQPPGSWPLGIVSVNDLFLTPDRIDVTGGIPGLPCLMALSLRNATSTIAGVNLYVDLSAGNAIAYFVVDFDASGGAFFDLRALFGLPSNPLYGLSIYAQALALSPTTPGTLIGSPGMQITLP